MSDEEERFSLEFDEESMTDGPRADANIYIKCGDHVWPDLRWTDRVVMLAGMWWEQFERVLHRDPATFQFMRGPYGVDITPHEHAGCHVTAWRSDVSDRIIAWECIAARETVESAIDRFVQRLVKTSTARGWGASVEGLANDYLRLRRRPLAPIDRGVPRDLGGVSGRGRSRIAIEIDKTSLHRAGGDVLGTFVFRCRQERWPIGSLKEPMIASLLEWCDPLERLAAGRTTEIALSGEVLRIELLDERGHRCRLVSWGERYGGKDFLRQVRAPRRHVLEAFGGLARALLDYCRKSGLMNENVIALHNRYSRLRDTARLGPHGAPHDGRDV